MRFYNESRYPDDEVRALVEFAAGDIDTRRVAVKVKNLRRKGYRGRYYHGTPSISPTAQMKSVDYLITLKIGPADGFPVRHHGRYKTAPKFTLETWQEALVYLAAHEWRHHYQYTRDRVKGEVYAIKYGHRRLEAYRLDS